MGTLCKNGESESFIAGYNHRLQGEKGILPEDINRYDIHEYKRGWRQAILESSLITEVEHGFILSEN